MADDSMMSSNDSRKRSLDSDTDHSQTKRTNQSEHVLLKQLIPGTLAGALLGKGGGTIAKMTNDTNTSIKMSKAGDFYPGTNDRVLIITGAADSVQIAHGLVWEKLRERIESVEDPKVKLVVPHPTVGMIIGKGGTYIKSIKDSTGAFVQISQKAPDTRLLERVVTIGGTPQSQRDAFDMVFAMIREDPQSGSCPNISYADYKGPVANSNPKGSPFAYTGDTAGGMNVGMNQMNAALGQIGSAMGAMGGVMGSIGGVKSMQYAFQNPPVESVKSVLRNAGHSVQASEEISAALCTLAQYGLLGFGSGYGPYGYGIGALGAGGGNMGGLSLEYLTSILCGGGMGGDMQGGAVSNGGGGVFSSRSIFGGSQRGGIDDAGGFNGARSTGGGGGGGSSKDSGSVSEELQVDEAFVGAVLGHGGKAIVEIQRMTSAVVRISKKGVYAPGTRKRVVTVTGMPQSVERAVRFVKECISQEETKRARQDQMKIDSIV